MTERFAVIPFAKTIFSVSAAAMAGGLALSAAQAQIASPAADAFNFPEDISFIQQGDPNMRRATARVNGNIITGTDVDERVALFAAGSDRPYSPEEMEILRLRTLRSLIDETLQVQEAAAQEMPVAAEQVAAEYERFAVQRFNMTVPELDAYLLSVGSSARSVKRQIQGELAWERLKQRNVSPFVNVSTNEVEEIHQRIAASQGTLEFRVGEIFLQSTPATQERVQANAQQIVQQLREGGSFEGYAAQFSDASSKAQGGDLGWLRIEQLQNPQLETIVREMAPGQLVGPVPIPGGFSILFLRDKRQIGMADPRDALVSLKQIGIEFAPGTSEAQAEAQANAFIDVVQSMNGCGDADAKASAMGAQTQQSDQMSVRDLPEVLQNVVLSLSVGQTTPPFGDLAEGVRILMLCGRDDPAPVSAPSMDNLMAQMENERVNKRAQRYLRDLRRDAVIEYN